MSQLPKAARRAAAALVADALNTAQQMGMDVTPAVWPAMADLDEFTLLRDDAGHWVVDEGEPS